MARNEHPSGEQVRAYLKALFPDGAEHIEVRPQPRDRGDRAPGPTRDRKGMRLPKQHRPHAHRRFCATIDEAVEAVLRAETAGLNVHVGHALRSKEGARLEKGAKDFLVKTCVVPLDLDGDPAEIDERLAKFAVEHGHGPGMVVASSERGGRHAYFFTAEPFPLATPEDVESYENILAGLALVLKADPAATDAPRTLRCPGTTNRPSAAKQSKYGRGDSPCVLLTPYDGQPIPRAWFEQFAEAGHEHRLHRGNAAEYKSSDWDGTCPAAVRDLLERDPRARQRYERATQTDDSRTDWSLALMLVCFGFEPVEVEHALRASRKEHGGPGTKPKDQQYFKRTVGRALAFVSERRTQEYAQVIRDLNPRLQFQFTDRMRPAFRGLSVQPPS